MFAHSGGQGGRASLGVGPAAHQPAPLPWGQEQSVAASDMEKNGGYRRLK